QCRNDAPGHKDPSNPDTRTELVQHHVTGHFKQEIADEENAGHETESLTGQREFFIHLQCRIADIGAVEIGHDVEQENERDDAQGDLANDGGFIWLIVVHGGLIGTGQGLLHSLL
nr:hypothetical protein [Tanacetum cinerariifolium]